MKIKTTNLSNKTSKEINLNEKIFGILPREDIVSRVIRWQLAKRRLGNHSVKTRSQIKMTTAKMYKQKGTGKARHGSGSVSQFRGGGMAHGPVVHSHAIWNIYNSQSVNRLAGGIGKCRDDGIKCRQSQGGSYASQ